MCGVKAVRVLRKHAAVCTLRGLRVLAPESDPTKSVTFSYFFAEICAGEIVAFFIFAARRFAQKSATAKACSWCPEKYENVPLFVGAPLALQSLLSALPRSAPRGFHEDAMKSVCWLQSRKFGYTINLLLP